MRPIAPVITVLVAAAAAYLGSSLVSRADAPTGARFVMLSEGKTNNVWELNQDTGEVRVCMPATDPKLPPDCSPKGAW
jgi:hypothetical protein